jgi:predicted acetyltransferase
MILVRRARNTGTLPVHMLGHIGFDVLQWKRRRGYAT